MKSYQECLDDIKAGRGNDFMDWVPRYKEREQYAPLFAEMEVLIRKMFYPQFISYPEEAEHIASLIRMTQRQNILEVGMFSGFTTLHMLKAVIPHGHVTAVDNQKVFPDFFDRPEIQKHFKFVHGNTPEVLEQLNGQVFDFVYVDSDHSPKHTGHEMERLLHLTVPGSIFAFHDCPSKLRPEEAAGSGPMHQYINSLISSGLFRGMILPTCDRLDVKEQWGPQYQRELLPHMAVLIRT